MVQLFPQTVILRSLLGLLVAFLPVRIQAAPGKPPNVLLIVSDDQGWGDYGFMGHPHIQTPNLDRLAAESRLFRRGYTPVPVCRPSLVSILTGRYPHQHGVTGNDPALPGKAATGMRGRLDPRFQPLHDAVIANFARWPNLVRDLSGRGYVTLQTGKWWEGNPIKVAGFTHAMTDGEGKTDRHGGAGLAIGRNGIGPVRKFLDETAGKPWMIWYAPMLPHSPHTPPQPLLEKYLKVAPTPAVARYWACVEWFDRGCGEVLDEIAKRGERENTVVVYVTDNGYIQNPALADRFAPRSKMSPYEGGVRTPLMVSMPGRIAPGDDRVNPVSTIDIWPTLAPILGTEAPKDAPGVNLLDTGRVAGRARIFGAQYRHDIANVHQPEQSREHRWVIEGWWKLILPEATNPEKKSAELYDLEHDPTEERDLAANQAERVKALTQAIDTEWRATSDPN